MADARMADLQEPHIEVGKPLLIAGLSERYAFNAMAAAATGIQVQWQQLAPHLGRVPGQVGRAAYGVCGEMSSGEAFHYLCGVEVMDIEHMPDGFAHVCLPAHTYAAFAHNGHVTEVRSTLDAIWHGGLVKAGLEADKAVDFFIEYYGEAFDPATGRGGIEIRIPVKV